MTMLANLGRLESVPVREIWPHEAIDFTPWLAENLTLLAETLDMGELRYEGRELKVGDFNLDILARDIEGRVVLIENQFGPTDHTHLGQLITYLAAQKGSATVIWIAERFREEHRAAVDWLNAGTAEGFYFFAVEVEALRIGVLPPAPWFNIIAKPNGWSRGVARATGAAVGQQDDRAKAYTEYWAGFDFFLKDKGAPYRMRSVPRDYWCSFGIGRTGFLLAETASFGDRKLGVEVYISHRSAKRAFELLELARAVIEDEFGTPLSWDRMDGKKGCRIAVYRSDLDPRDEDQRAAQYEWFLEQMLRFSRTFRQRITALPLEDESDIDALPLSEVAES